MIFFNIPDQITYYEGMPREEWSSVTSFWILVLITLIGVYLILRGLIFLKLWPDKFISAKRWHDLKQYKTEKIYVRWTRVTSTLVGVVLFLGDFIREVNIFGITISWWWLFFGPLVVAIIIRIIVRIRCL